MDNESLKPNLPEIAPVQAVPPVFPELSPVESAPPRPLNIDSGPPAVLPERIALPAEPSTVRLVPKPQRRWKGKALLFAAAALLAVGLKWSASRPLPFFSQDTAGKLSAGLKGVEHRIKNMGYALKGRIVHT